MIFTRIVLINGIMVAITPKIPETWILDVHEASWTKSSDLKIRTNRKTKPPMKKIVDSVSFKS